jgi:hypothetical protein
MANFHIDTDKVAIGRINESLSTLQQARGLRIREAESALKSRSMSINLACCDTDRLLRVFTQIRDVITTAQ